MQRHVLGGVLLALATAAAVAGAPATAPAADEVKLGLGLAESGPLAYLCSQYEKGYQAAVATANAEGKVKFTLVTVDHRGIPSDAVNVAKRLIEQENVKTIDMCLPSTVVLAVMQISKQAKVPLIGGDSKVPSLVDEGNPFFFRTSSRSDVEAATAAKIMRDQNYKTIAMLAPNDDYGRGALEYMEKALAANGGPRVVYKDFYERNQVDFSAILLKMKSLNPDALNIDVRYPASVTVLKQMAEIGLKKPLFADVNAYNAKLAEQVGPLLEGTYLWLDWAPEFADAASQTFIAAYKKVDNSVPDPNAADGWTAAMTAIKAIEATGAGASGEEIRAAMAGLDFIGPTGRIRFDTKGDANAPTKILLYRNGRYNPVE
jgi:branched-chain amino acid transport system substrate-binding protein